MNTSEKVPVRDGDEERPSSSSSNDDETSQSSRALVWKLDTHVLPMVTLLYLLSFLDRSNVANARIEGLTQDLHMTGIEFE